MSSTIQHLLDFHHFHCAQYAAWCLHQAKLSHLSRATSQPRSIWCWATGKLFETGSLSCHAWRLVISKWINWGSVLYTDDSILIGPKCRGSVLEFAMATDWQLVSTGQSELGSNRGIQGPTTQLLGREVGTTTLGEKQWSYAVISNWKLCMINGFVMWNYKAFCSYIMKQNNFSYYLWLN